MECEDLLTYLSDYIDQNLDGELRADAQEHLATCHNCRVVLDTTQQMIFLYQRQGQRSIPAARRQRLFNELQRAFLRREEPVEDELDG